MITSMKGTRARLGHISLIVLALLAGGCKRRVKAGSATTAVTAEPAPKVTAIPEDNGARPAAAPARPLLNPLLKFVPADGLRGPAAVIHDDASDVYLVS